MASRKEYFSLAGIAAVLIAAIWLVRAHAPVIRDFIGQHPVPGVFLYVLLNIVDAVVAPGATLPLIPVAVHVWGHVPAALVTTAGWTAGSLLAFLIARRWGTPLVRKLTSIERIKRLKPYIPKNLFWSVVAIRMVLPMDAISYALGLFTDMPWSTYAAATALGLTPAAFVLAYLGKKTHAYDIITILIACMVGIAIIVSVRSTSRPAKPAVRWRTRLGLAGASRSRRRA